MRRRTPGGGSSPSLTIDSRRAKADDHSVNGHPMADDRWGFLRMTPLFRGEESTATSTLALLRRSRSRAWPPEDTHSGRCPSGSAEDSETTAFAEAKRASRERTPRCQVLVLSASQIETWGDARIRTEALVSGALRLLPYPGHRAVVQGSSSERHTDSFNAGPFANHATAARRANGAAASTPAGAQRAACAILRPWLDRLSDLSQRSTLTI
jgi:hypothetical protein